MSEEHPIQDLMATALDSIKDMVDVDTIIGDPIETPDKTAVILPVSKVGFGFASGGSEFADSSSSGDSESSSQSLPFGGGAGGGVSITPIAFLIVRPDDIQMVHMNDQTHLMENLLELAPKAADYVKSLINNQGGQQQHNHQSNSQQGPPPSAPEQS